MHDTRRWRREQREKLLAAGASERERVATKLTFRSHESAAADVDRGTLHSLVARKVFWTFGKLSEEFWE